MIPALAQLNNNNNNSSRASSQNLIRTESEVMIKYAIVYGNIGAMRPFELHRSNCIDEPQNSAGDHVTQHNRFA